MSQTTTPPVYTIAFDYTRWITAYPQFATTVPTAAQGQVYFNLAQRLCDNTAYSPIRDASVGGELETDLWLLTAHFAQLMAGSTLGPAAQGAGPVSSAGEGSVSVSFAIPESQGAIDSFLSQTQFGRAFLAMTAQYRIFRPNPAGQQFNQLGQPGAAIPIPYIALLRGSGWF